LIDNRVDSQSVARQLFVASQKFCLYFDKKIIFQHNLFWKRNSKDENTLRWR